MALPVQTFPALFFHHSVPKEKAAGHSEPKATTVKPRQSNQHEALTRGVLESYHAHFEYSHLWTRWTKQTR